MIVLGLAGQAGAGKDTVADYLVRRYGFVKFSFSDALYREVVAAFGLDDEDLLRDRKTKDCVWGALQLDRCRDDAFKRVCAPLLERAHPDWYGPWGSLAMSPRQVLQWWGTEYRRAQDPDYWINAADRWVYDLWAACRYPEHRPQLFVNTSTRFENERRWIHQFSNGQVWHIRRDGAAAVHAHESEKPLEVLHDVYLDTTDPRTGTPMCKRVFERELYNNDSLERLYGGIELLLGTQARFVKVEPMLTEAERRADEVHLVETFGDTDAGARLKVTHNISER